MMRAHKGVMGIAIEVGLDTGALVVGSGQCARPVNLVHVIGQDALTRFVNEPGANFCIGFDEIDDLVSKVNRNQKYCSKTEHDAAQTAQVGPPGQVGQQIDCQNSCGSEDGAAAVADDANK
ncbi:hypothetical protein D3C72_1596510 [compost metagenome]